MIFFRRKEPERIEIRKGYDLWSRHYASEKNPIKSASDVAVKEMLPALHGKSVVDAGCGTGYFCGYAEEAGAASVTGIDFSEGMIKQAKQRCPNTRFIVGEIQALDVKSPADIIICALVLGHLQEIRPVLAAFEKNLKKGGTLVLTDFHPYLSQQGHKRTFQSEKKVFEIPHHIHTLDHYRDCLAEVGLSLEITKDHIWNKMPVVFALRATKIA